MEYRVMWEADVEAANPEAAARMARNMQIRRGSIATVFEVWDAQGQGPVRVDLTEIDQAKPVSDVDAALGFSTEDQTVTVNLGRVDWELLRRQKLALLEGKPDVDAVDGVIALIDRIQDEAEKQLGEEAVFGQGSAAKARQRVKEFFAPIAESLKLEPEVIDAGEGSDLATILAALRLFQAKYEDSDSEAIRADWPEHFKDSDGKPIAPLGTDDIDALCERLNYGRADKPAQPTGEVKIWILATDDGDNGTEAEVFSTERGLYERLIEWASPDEDEGEVEELAELLKDGDYDAIQEKVDDIRDPLNTYGITVHTMEVPVTIQAATARPRVLVTIVGGVGEVAENEGDVEVDILDYDNLKDLYHRVSSDSVIYRDLILSDAQLAYIRKHDDAEFVAWVEAARAPESGGSTGNTELVAAAPAIASTSKVWVTGGDGDYCPETAVIETELAAWKYVAEWLKDFAEAEMDNELEDTSLTYHALLDAALATGQVAALRPVVEKIAQALDSTITVEQQEVRR